jgi:hypothetical protein
LRDQHTVRANTKFRRAQLGESQSARCQQVPNTVDLGATRQDRRGEM